MGTARTRANNKWNAKAYDRVNLILKKEASPTKEEIQAAADANGESLNGYIVEAIRQRLESVPKESAGQEDEIPNAETQAAIEEVEEMIKTGKGQHFKGSTVDFFSKLD